MAGPLLSPIDPIDSLKSVRFRFMVPVLLFRGCGYRNAYEGDPKVPQFNMRKCRVQFLGVLLPA